MDQDVAATYGNKVRVRVSGLCIEGQRLLMVNHKGVTDAAFWAPPGGGVDFGRSAQATLIKEFQEETGLKIEVGKFLFAGEYIGDPIHSVELFFVVSPGGGKLKVGSDPELDIIDDVRYMTFDEIIAKGDKQSHGIFRHVSSLQELVALRGFYRL